MGDKKVLTELIEVEREYFRTLQVGTPEYAESQERLMNLEKQVSAQKESVGKTVLEGAKVVTGVLLPMFGWVVITSFEKNESITSSLKKTIDCFLPKRP